MKNQHNSILAFRRYDGVDIIILLLFFLIVVLRMCSNFILIPNLTSLVDKTIFEMVSDFLLVFSFTGFTLSLRFRNLSFASIWILLSLTYILIDKRPITFTALLLFISYFLLRFIFRKIYNKELILCYLKRGGSTPYFSVLDKMESTKQDAVFTWIFFLVNFFIALVCVYFSPAINK